MKDPNTGQFTPGNPGRPKGSKNVRTLQWEELGDTITGYHAAHFTTLLDELWKSKDMTERMKGADLFLRTLDYFKPKLQRIQLPLEGKTFPTPIIQLANPEPCTTCGRDPSKDTHIIRHIIHQKPSQEDNLDKLQHETIAPNIAGDSPRAY